LKLLDYPFSIAFLFAEPGYPSMQQLIIKVSAKIFGHRWINSFNKINLWAEMINMNSAALKPQDLGVLRFRGTIQTDNADVTVLKKKDMIESIDILVFKVLS
jgi:hypothetical protein